MSSLSPADVFNLFDNSAFPGDTGRRERGIGGGRWDMDGSIRSRERFYRGVNGYFVKVMYAPVKPFLFYSRNTASEHQIRPSQSELQLLWYMRRVNTTHAAHRIRIPSESLLRCSNNGNDSAVNFLFVGNKNNGFIHSTRPTCNQSSIIRR